MHRKVFKTGNSIVVALPKEMLEALRIGEGEEVSVELDTERRQILIAPAPAAADGVDAEFARQVANFIAAYRPALEALAR
jgi:antitoxin MazE